MNEAEISKPSPEPPVANQVANGQAGSVSSRILARARNILRRPLVRGLALWAALLTVAYLVGTLAIAPMISEAAGLGTKVYTVERSSRIAHAGRDPGVQISPVAAQPVAAVVSPAKHEKERRKRRRRHRQRELPPDMVFLAHGHENNEEQKAEPPAPDTRQERSDDERKDFGDGGGDSGGEGGGADFSGGVQEGESLGDG